MPFPLSPVATNYNNEIQVLKLSLVDEQSLQLHASVTTLNETPHMTPIDNLTLDAALTQGLPIYDPQTQAACLLIKHEHYLYKVPFQKLDALTWGPLAFRNAKQLNVTTTFWNPVNLTLDKARYAQHQPCLLSDAERTAVMQQYQSFVANPETDTTHKMAAQTLRNHLESFFKRVSQMVDRMPKFIAPMDEFHYKMVCEIILDPWLALQHEAPSTHDYALALGHIIRDTDVYDTAVLEALAVPIENLRNAMSVTAINRFGALFHDHRKILDIYVHILKVMRFEIARCGLPAPIIIINADTVKRLAIKIHQKNTLALVCIEAKLERNMKPKIGILSDVLTRHYNHYLNQRTRAAPFNSTYDIFIPLIPLTAEAYEPLATLATSLNDSPPTVLTLSIKKALNKIRALEEKPSITAFEWETLTRIFDVLAFCKTFEQATVTQTPIACPELFFQGEFFAMAFDQLSANATLRFAEAFIPLIASNLDKINDFHLIASRLLLTPFAANVIAIIEPYIANITLQEAEKWVVIVTINQDNEFRAIVTMLLKPLTKLSQSVHSYADFKPFLSYMSHLSRTELNAFLTNFPAISQILTGIEDFQALLTDPIFLASLNWQETNNANFAGQLIFALAKSRLHDFIKTPADFKQLLNYIINNRDIVFIVKELAHDLATVLPDVQSVLDIFYHADSRFFATLRANATFKTHFLSRINSLDDIITVTHSGYQHQVALIASIKSKFLTYVTNVAELTTLLRQLHYKNARLDVLTTLAPQLPALITTNDNTKAVLALLPTDALKDTFLTAIASVLPNVTETLKDFATFYQSRDTPITAKQLSAIYSHNLLAAPVQNDDDNAEAEDFDFPYDAIKTTLSRALHNMTRANSRPGLFQAAFKTPIIALAAAFLTRINDSEKSSLEFQQDLLVFYLTIKAVVTTPLQATDALYRCIYESMKCLETLHEKQALVASNAPAATVMEEERITWQDGVNPPAKIARFGC